MTEKKKRINAVIPEELYIKISESGYSLTEAIIKGIELVLENKKGLKEAQGFDNKQPMLEELTHLRTKSEELQAHNETLKENLKRLVRIKRISKKRLTITWCKSRLLSIKKQLKHLEKRNHGGDFGNSGYNMLHNKISRE